MMTDEELREHKLRMLSFTLERRRQRAKAVNKLLDRLYRYISMMASHQRARLGCRLLIEATAMIEELRENVNRQGGGEDDAADTKRKENPA